MLPEMSHGCGIQVSIQSLSQSADAPLSITPIT